MAADSSKLVQNLVNGNDNEPACDLNADDVNTTRLGEDTATAPELENKEFLHFAKIQCRFGDFFRPHGSLIETRMSSEPPLGISRRPRKRKIYSTQLASASITPLGPRADSNAIPPRAEFIGAEQTAKDEDPAAKNEPSETPSDSQSTQPLSQADVLLRPDIYLSNEQKAVLHRILTTRNNVFYTGAAGTGKSVLSRCIIQELKKLYPWSGAIAITATTGIAACQIQGMTLHSWAGIGLGKEPINYLIDRIERNDNSRTRWQTCRVLIIDEISMLSFDLLEKLDLIAKAIRRNSLPFGGIQLVLTGDLFQLPPVNKDADMDPTEFRRYCFEADCWRHLVDKTFRLTQVFRQTDTKFADMLNDLRIGKVTDEANLEFKNLCRPAKVPKGIRATKLYPKRLDVDTANQTELDRLDGATYEYVAMDEITTEGKKAGISMDTGLAPNSVKLKVGAQVMMIKNMNKKLVNGSIGKVIGFVTEGSLGPLKEVDKNEITGGYEAREMGGNSANCGERKERRAHMLEELDKSSDVKWPWVRFLAPDNTSQTVIVKPEKWEIRDSDDKVIAARSQVPLLLSWAMSIHKSQGQTLPYVSINLEKTFEKGQAYVAISRATCLSGLHLARFDRRHVRVDLRVVQFYENLDGISQDEIDRAVAFFDTEYEFDPVGKASLADAEKGPYEEILDSSPEDEEDIIPIRVVNLRTNEIKWDNTDHEDTENDPSSRKHDALIDSSYPSSYGDQYTVHSAVKYFPPSSLDPIEPHFVEQRKMG